MIGMLDVDVLNMCEKWHLQILVQTIVRLVFVTCFKNSSSRNFRPGATGVHRVPFADKTVWPPRLPDISPLDFSVWNWLQN